MPSLKNRMSGISRTIPRFLSFTTLFVCSLQPVWSYEIQSAAGVEGCVILGGTNIGGIIVGGTEYCCKRTTPRLLRWSIQRKRSSFPDGTPETEALKTAADRWNSLANTHLQIIGSDSTTLSINGVSELGYKSGGFSSEDTLATTPAINKTGWSVKECGVIERDVYFNSKHNFHAAEDAQHSPYYLFAEKTNYVPNLVATALHEFGHVLGLDHEADIYNIMGISDSHVNRNGDVTYYGPGEDGAAGARSLYGDRSGGAFDLGVSIFARVGKKDVEGQVPYSTHDLLGWKQGESDVDRCKGSKIDGVKCYTVDANTTVDIPFTFENNGSREENVLFTVYLSGDNFIDTSDEVLRRYSTRLMPDGSPLEYYLPVPIPGKLLTNSTWYIGVIVERKPGLLPPGSIPDEVDYKNNAAWYPFTVRKGDSPPTTPLSLGLTDLRLVINPNQSRGITPMALDPDGDPLRYFVLTSPIHGIVTATSGRYKFVYTPDFDFVGNDSFQYRVEDPYGLSATGEIKVSIVLPKHDAVVNKLGAGSGTVISNPGGIDCGTVCVAEFAENAVLHFTATPDKGSVFLGWDAGCNGISSCVVAMNQFQTVTARFEIAPTNFTLTVDKVGKGAGVITSNPVGIDCGEDCAEDYLAGANTQVTLTPNPAAGSTFIGWNGACSGTGACTVTMFANQNITAAFAASTPTIFTVDNLGDSGAGSLRQAILDANVNAGDDIIQFQRGLTGTIALISGQLAITDSLVIDGPGANVLAISGNNASRIFKINPGAIGTVAINGLTLKKGNDVSGNGGGAVIIDSGTVTINNCTLSNNSAGIDNGGGGGGPSASLALVS